MEFYKFLEIAVDKFPTRNFISVDEVNHTYKDIFEDVNKIRNKLILLNVLGVKIGIVESDQYWQLVNFLGVLASKNIPIIMHPDISCETLDLLKSKDEFVLLNKCNGEKLYKIDTLNKDEFGVLSSGTTGLPKLVFRSEESWIKAFSYQSELFNLREGCKVFLHGSFSFTANLNYALHILSLGGSIISTTNFMPGKWVKKIQENKVSGVFLVPSKYRLLVKKCNSKFAFVCSITSAGEKLQLDIAKGLKRVFTKAEIVEYYGTSETSFITYNTFDCLKDNQEGVGKIFPGVKLTVEDKQGDIFVESEYLAKCYINGFKVNDKGYINENGVLCLSGRGNDVINKAGEKISIKNIENTLKECNVIEEYIVFSFKNRTKGEDIAAALIVNDHGLSEVDITKILKKKLPKNEIPRILMIEKFPYNISGKVDICKIRSMLFNRL